MRVICDVKNIAIKSAVLQCLLLLGLSYSIILWESLPGSEKIFKIQKKIVRLTIRANKNKTCWGVFKKLTIPSKYIFRLFMFLNNKENLFENYLSNNECSTHSKYLYTTFLSVGYSSIWEIWYPSFIHGYEISWPPTGWIKAKMRANFSRLKKFLIKMEYYMSNFPEWHFKRYFECTDLSLMLKLFYWVFVVILVFCGNRTVFFVFIDNIANSG